MYWLNNNNNNNYTYFTQGGHIRKTDHTSVFDEASSSLPVTKSPISRGHLANAVLINDENLSEREIKETENITVSDSDRNAKTNSETRTHQESELNKCFATASDMALINENLDVVSEIGSIAENCCDRRSPCPIDDRVSVSSWNNYPLHCPHLRIQHDLNAATHTISPQHISSPSCQGKTIQKSLSSPHQHTHIHPASFNRATFMPHQPSSLPEQNAVHMELENPNSRVFVGHNDHQDCMQNQTINSDVPNSSQVHFNTHHNRDHHRHHHLHQIQSPHSHTNAPTCSVQCNPMLHSHGNNIQSNSYTIPHLQNQGIQRSLTVESPKQSKFSINERNCQDSTHQRPPTNAHTSVEERQHQRFSALSPADLCGYTSDTQDSRCCQQGK